jgi:DNA-binding LytR/AlgR family response regulator
MKLNWIVAGISGLALASVLAAGALAQGTGTQGQGHARQVRPLLRARELVREAFQQLRPQVRALLDTLTPEQRARVAALAQRHGRTLDEARVERRLAFLLSRPGAAARIQRNLER